MKRCFLFCFLCYLLSCLPASADREKIATGNYVLTEIGIRPGESLHPYKNHIETYAAKITEEDGEYVISIRYGRAGVISVPFHLSGDRISFFIRPDSGSVDGKDLLATGFFGSRSGGAFKGWATYGSNRSVFLLDSYEGFAEESAD